MSRAKLLAMVRTLLSEKVEHSVKKATDVEEVLKGLHPAEDVDELLRMTLSELASTLTLFDLLVLAEKAAQ